MSAQLFLKKMTRKGFTIAFAESMTGGALSHELVKYRGASKVLKASIVAYTVEQKMSLLGLQSKEFIENQIVSKELAIQMAKSISDKCGSTISVGVTGNAGPTLQNHTKKKEAYIAILYQDDVKIIHLDLEDLSRIKAIKKVVKETYQMLLSLV